MQQDSWLSRAFSFGGGAAQLQTRLVLLWDYFEDITYRLACSMYKSGCGMGTKKRKHDGPLDDIERSLYSSFSAAANGISVLYTQALTQQRKAYCLGSRAMAERVLGWLEGESEQVEQKR